MSYFNNLFKNIRFYVLFFSACLSLGIFLFVKLTIPEGTTQTIKLTQFYALSAVTYLYIALLATPLIRTFPTLPLRGYYVKARRGIGVSAFYFASLHAYFAFFKQLGGFEGLGFLTNTYLVAITLSATSLLVLSLMALTSFDSMVKLLTYKRWKLLHRFIYLAGIFILVHAVMLGTHFQNLSGLIPQILWVALAFLFILEALRVDRYLLTRYQFVPKIGISLFIISVVLFSSLLFVLFPVSGNGISSLNIHSQHLQLARNAQSKINALPGAASNPSLQGDAKKRYTVSFSHDDSLQTNIETSMKFHIFDASSGNEVTFFRVNYTKPFHLIVVDSQLEAYQHLHPTAKGSLAEVPITFPHDGTYHLYLDFQPVGAIEQQFAFTVTVGSGEKRSSSSKPDKELTKTFGDYLVSLAYPKPLKSSKLSVGEQQLTFTVMHAKTKKPVTTLKPYLASFGHMIMINAKTYEYVHVHPTMLQAPSPDANGGPEVSFLPLGLYGPIKPGVYKVFTQLNPNGQLILATYTIEVKD